MMQGDVRVSVKIPARMTINNSAAILAAVEAGAGIGLMPEFTAKAALAENRVQAVLPEWLFCEPYVGSAYAVYVPGRHLALKVRALIDHLVEASALG